MLTMPGLLLPVSLVSFPNKMPSHFPLAFILAEILFIRNKQQKIDRKFLGIFRIRNWGRSSCLGLSSTACQVNSTGSAGQNTFYTQFRVLVKYWQLLFLPINQHLDYYFTISTTLWGVKELLGLRAIPADHCTWGLAFHEEMACGFICHFLVLPDPFPRIKHHPNP